MIEFLTAVLVLALIAASQIFWIRQVRKAGARWVLARRWRSVLGTAAIIVYFGLLLYNLFGPRSHPTPTHMTWQAALLQAPFWLWTVGSLVGFSLLILLWGAKGLVRGLLTIGRRRLPAQPDADPPSPDRRRFLEGAAVVASAAPFVAGAYGLFYERLNLEVTHPRIKLRRLPRAFDGFRIAQLSDIHIGPFMTAEQIRRFVAITNELRPDLVVLTGDFIIWKPAPLEAVADALSRFKAPFGTFGCVGNHETWAGVQDSITQLFQARGVPMLRLDRAPLHLDGEMVNLLGVDFQSNRPMGHHIEGLVRHYLEGVQPLLRPDTVNILLSHNPNTFERAAELGIDLTLAGHTHGGQLTLEFIHPDLSPSRLITPYVAGHYRRGEAQLYVNRGIGTIGPPIRFAARPEITVLELVREA